jgi:tripartite-type tricarboxylate transporter receptor subunit TctC
MRLHFEGFMKTLRSVAFLMGACVWAIATEAGAEPRYPHKPIRLVLGNTPGGTGDFLARLIGAKFSDAWGQPVVIENRPGASGIVAATIVAKSAPDGHTLHMVSPAFAIRPAVFPDLPYDTFRDFATMGEIGFSNSVIVVAPSLGVRTVKEFIAYANTHRGRIFFGSAGAGTATHMGAERFRMAAGIKAQHVGFKGQSEFQLEIVAGRIHFASTGLTAALDLIRQGKMQPIAVAQRTEQLPDVPSYAEALPGFRRDGSQGLFAPARTPMPIRQQISRELERVLTLPDVKQRLDAVSFNIAYSTPEQHETNLRNDVATFTKIVKEAGLRVH